MLIKLISITIRLVACLLVGTRFSLAESNFTPITEALNFRASFRVQTFAQTVPLSTSDVFESYHSGLATGLVRHIIQDEVLGAERETTNTKYLYDSHGKRLVEFIGAVDGQQPENSDELFHDNFYLFENGGTNSYQSHSYSKESVQDNLDKCNNYFKSVQLVPEDFNLDNKLLMSGADSSLPHINLDRFMTSECLARIKSSLHYIYGLSRLLHLIECRRDEFKLLNVTSETRGQAVGQYRAEKLTPIPSNGVLCPASATVRSSSCPASIDISITLAKADHPNGFGQTLDSGAIPLSFLISFEPSVSILVNVYQFESMGVDEHLSESASSHSIFMMPLARPGLSFLLNAIQRAGRDEDVDWASRRSFSFQGSITGSALSKFFRDPIEISMSHDADLLILSSEMSFVDRTETDGLNGWARSRVRQLLDGQSSLKFHLMERNFGYRHLSSGGTTNGSDSQNWRSCATNHLSGGELKLVTGEGGDLFNLSGAIYMGMALVRGIPCHVYERLLFKLPSILALEPHNYEAIYGQHDIFLTAYVYYKPTTTTHDERQPVFTRLHLRVTRADLVLTSWVLDLSSFSWSPEDFIGDGSLSHQTLVELMTQECLLVVPNARHLDVELWFKRSNVSDAFRDSGQKSRGIHQTSGFNSDETKLVRELELNRELRDYSLVEMLARSLKISPVQQVDFKSELSLQPTSTSATDRSNWLLHVKFSLYELWNDLVEEEFIGYARDLSFNTRMPSDSTIYALGVRSYSYDECKWRAVHSLQPATLRSEYNRRDESMLDSLRLFLFCPHRLICILGDSSWLPMRRKQSLRLDELLEFPYHEANGNSDSIDARDDTNRCLVSSVIIRQQSMLSKAAGLQSCRSKLEWWLTSGRHGSRATGTLDDEEDDEETLARLRVRELRYELKVRSAPPPIRSRALQATATTISGDRQAYQQHFDSFVRPDRGGGGGGGNNNNGGGNIDGGATRRASGLGLGYGNAQWPLQPMATRSLLLEVSKLKLSNKILISNAEADYRNTSGAAQLEPLENGDELPMSLLVKPLAGLAYALRQPDTQSTHNNGTATITTIKPLVVSNLAECARTCLLLHECQSFSACHQQIGAWSADPARSKATGGGISCAFAKLVWSNRNDVNQLMRLSRAANSPGRSGQAEQQVVVESSLADSGGLMGGGDAVAASGRLRIDLKLSPLCSLHARPQLDLFRLRRSHSEVQPKVEYLIYAKSAEQCARFCQDRAELMRQLAAANESRAEIGISGESRSAACHEFYYSVDNQYCKLIPLLNHWRALNLEHYLPKMAGRKAQQQQVAADGHLSEGRKLNELTILARWRHWFERRTPHASWIRRLESFFGESDYYELDYKQIFLVHQNQRLAYESGADGPEATRLQARVWLDSKAACGELCLRRKGCRSFSVRSGSSRPRNVVAVDGAAAANQRTLCLLNAVSGRDLIYAAHSAERPDSGRSSSLAAFKLEHSPASAESKSGGEVWWHYEASELALFIITDPDEPTNFETFSSSGGRNEPPPPLDTTTGGVLIDWTTTTSARSSIN